MSKLSTTTSPPVASATGGDVAIYRYGQLALAQGRRIILTY